MKQQMCNTHVQQGNTVGYIKSKHH